MTISARSEMSERNTRRQRMAATIDVLRKLSSSMSPETANTKVRSRNRNRIFHLRCSESADSVLILVSRMGQGSLLSGNKIIAACPFA